MADPQSVNLPDLLGAITNGERVNLNVVQAALGVHPRTTPAGRPFEVILLLQNASDVDVDVNVRVRLPDRDAKNDRNRFFAQKERLLVGLRPAEVGYVTLPASCSPKTAVEKGYQVAVDIQVKTVGNKKPERIRSPEGGGVLVETELPEDIQEHIWHLQQMVFSAERTGRSTLAAHFNVKKSEIGGMEELSPGWTTLWTMRDHVDKTILADRVRNELDVLLPRLGREAVFFPLLDVLQTRFREDGGYPLRAGEAVFIAKALTLVVEQGVTQVSDDIADLEEDLPEWFLRTCRVLFDRPEAAKNATYLLQELVFYELVRDAIRLGMTMVSTVMDEDFGDDQAEENLVGDILESLHNGSLDYTRVYLPLVMAGLIANTRIVMAQERPRDTIWLLHKDQEQRAREKHEANTPVFQMVEQLIDRALEQTG